MADPNDSEALRKLNELIDSLTASGNPIKVKEAERLKSIETTIRANNDYIGSLKNARSVFGTTTNLLNRQAQAYVNHTEQIRSLDRAYKKATTDRERNAISENRRELDRAMLYQNTRAGIINFANTITGSVIDLAKSFGEATKNLVNNAMSDPLGFRTAGSFMTTMINSITGIVKSIGDFVASIGSEISKFGLLAGIAGTGLQILGKAAAAAASVMGQMAGIVVDVVVKTMEDLSQTFFTASRAGAVFGRGMDDIQQLANKAGLSISAMGKLFTESAQELARTNLGVSEGARRAVNTLSAGGSRLQTSLFGLGFALDEHAGVVASAMSNMTAAGDPFRASTPETVRATQELAYNMRLMANYTGEDLKRKLEEANQYKRYLTLNRKLMEMEPTERIKFQQKFALMTEQEKKNALDMMEFGQVVNKTGAMMMGTSSQYTDYMNNTYQSLMNSGTSLEEFERQRAARLPGIMQEMVNSPLSAVQTAGVGGAAGDLASSMGQQVKELGGRTLTGLENATKDTTGAMQSATGGLTGTVLTANKAMMDFKVFLEQTAIGLAPRFTELFASMKELISAITPLAVDAFKTLADIVTKITPKIAELAKETQKPGGGTVGSAVKEGAGLVGGVTGGALGAMGGRAAGQLGQGLLMAIPKLLKAAPHPGLKLLGLLLPYVGSAAGAIGGYLFGKDTAESAVEKIGEAIPERAIGGDIKAGKLYTVGERGPELFRSKNAGDIVPNNEYMRLLESASELFRSKNAVDIVPNNEYMKLLERMTGEISNKIDYFMQQLTDKSTATTPAKSETLLTELKQVLQEHTLLSKQAIELQQSVGDTLQDMRTINQQMLNAAT